MKKITGENIRRLANSRKLHSDSSKKNIIVNNDSLVNDSGDNIFLPIHNSTERNEIQKWERISGRDTVFISFVSDPPGSTFYSDRISNIIGSLDRLGYDYCIVHYDNDRNYYQNCCFKPSYIGKKIKEYNKNILWIDGDTTLKNGMDHFIGSPDNFDIGLVTYTGNIDGIIASPIFFKNTENSLELINEWADHCKNKIENGICELDHDALKHVILPNLRNRIRIKLNWDNNNSLHRGEILENVNSDVPNKRKILDEMSIINRSRPFSYNNQDFILI